MSEDERRAHEELLLSTGRFKFTREERDETIRRLMGDLELTLEDEDNSSEYDWPRR